MRQVVRTQIAKRNPVAGLTLIELVITCAILLILSSAALPMARTSIRRQKEVELRRELREMRDAIDRYKDAADKNLIQVEIGTQGYPPDLDTLVMGVTIGTGGTALLGAPSSQTGQSGTAVASKVRFLRKIPVDPMTHQAMWGLRAVEDDPDSDSWSGHDVFDVYSLSTATASDGTKYSDW